MTPRERQQLAKLLNNHGADCWEVHNDQLIMHKADLSLSMEIPDSEAVKLLNQLYIHALIWSGAVESFMTREARV